MSASQPYGLKLTGQDTLFLFPYILQSFSSPFSYLPHSVSQWFMSVPCPSLVKMPLSHIIIRIYSWRKWGAALQFLHMWHSIFGIQRGETRREDKLNANDAARPDIPKCDEQSPGLRQICFFLFFFFVKSWSRPDSAFSGFPQAPAMYNITFSHCVSHQSLTSWKDLW